MARDAAKDTRRDATKNIIKSKKAKATALAAYGENEDYSDLYAAIEALSEAEKDVIKALYFNGETARSYAEKTGSSKSAVSRLNVKACKALATALS